MKMSGSRDLPADQEAVWAALNDPEVLQRCIPGCESLEQTSPTELSAVAAVKIGPMKARFKGDVELSELNPPHSYRISGSGSGGAAGAASGGANVSLAPSETGTLLTYDVDAQVKGKMAQLGGRLIDATAKSLANQFFDNFAAEVAPAPAESAASEAVDAAAHGADVKGAAAHKAPAAGQANASPRGAGGTVPQWVYWAGAAALLATVAYFAVT